MMFASGSLKSVGVVLGAVLALIGCVAVAQSAKEAEPTKETVSISITQAPSAGPGESSFGDIAGTVKNAPKDSKVVIYSLGDTWYVQPYANAPFTEIGKDGKWSATIHGGNAFAALLVKPGYEPPATTSDLPKLGDKILAIAQAKRKQ